MAQVGKNGAVDVDVDLKQSLREFKKCLKQVNPGMWHGSRLRRSIIPLQLLYRSFGPQLLRPWQPNLHQKKSFPQFLERNMFPASPLPASPRLRNVCGEPAAQVQMEGGA